MRVFIGSTYEDLREHRRAVIDALSKLSVEIEAMELWYARPEDPLDVCLQRVAESDVYVCILAYRYGSMKRLKSFTHREYDAGVRSHARQLVFIMDTNYPVPGRFVDLGFAGWRLKRLKGRLRNRHLVAEFGSPSDLAYRVVESITDLMATERDTQAQALDLQEFWDSLKSDWHRVEPPELRLSFDAKDDALVLLDKLKMQLEGISGFHKAIESSHAELTNDLTALLRRIGADPARVENIPYWENPFVLRDAELLMLFPNRIVQSHALIAQARVNILQSIAERERTKAAEAALAEAKTQLRETLSSVLID